MSINKIQDGISTGEQSANSINSVIDLAEAHIGAIRYLKFKSELKAVDSTERSFFDFFAVKETNRIYEFNATTSSSDDSTDIIKPDDITGDGRFVKTSRFNQNTIIASNLVTPSSSAIFQMGVGDSALIFGNGKCYISSYSNTNEIEVNISGSVFIKRNADTDNITDFDITYLTNNVNDKGFFQTSTLLISTYPTGEDGWYALVGDTGTFWTWATSAWVDSGSAQTPIDFDSEPTESSTKAVTSGGVYEKTRSIKDKFRTLETVAELKAIPSGDPIFPDEVLDNSNYIAVLEANRIYKWDPDGVLSPNGYSNIIPDDKTHPDPGRWMLYGRFNQSSLAGILVDVQYANSSPGDQFIMSEAGDAIMVSSEGEFFINCSAPSIITHVTNLGNVADWKVKPLTVNFDDEPVEDSSNAVKSGGIYSVTSESKNKIKYIGTVAELRAFESAKIPYSKYIAVKSISRIFLFNSSSTATDNGYTVIKPDDIEVGNAGRFLLEARFNQDSLVAILNDGESVNSKIGDRIILSESGTFTVGNLDSGNQVEITTTAAAILEHLADTGVVGDFSVKEVGSLSNIAYADFTPQDPNPEHKEGREFYDDRAKTKTIYNDIVGSSMQVGRELWERVINKTGVDIPNFKAVYINGYDETSGRPTIALASASIAEAATGVLAFTTHLIADGSEGECVPFGDLNDIDTSLLTQGGLYFLSTTPGEISLTPPPTPNYRVEMGQCIFSDSTAGVFKASIGKKGNKQDTVQFFTGATQYSVTNEVTSDGSTVTLTVNNSVVGDIICYFREEIKEFTSGSTIALTAGTDTSPVRNVIWIDPDLNLIKATGTTANFPTSTEYIPVFEADVPSAAFVLAYGLYNGQSWTDHLLEDGDSGHLNHINYWIRQQYATYKASSGADYTYTRVTGTPDSLYFATTSCRVLQNHEHTFPAFDSQTGGLFLVSNDFTVPYKPLPNLNGLTNDATGSALGKYFNVVFYGVVSENAIDCKMYMLLPSGSYSNVTDALSDSGGYTNYAFPSKYKNSAFLISKATIQHSVNTWLVEDSKDLRGLTPSLASSGQSGEGSVSWPVSAGEFAVSDPTDPTKIVDLDVSGVGTGLTRTLTIPNKDITIAGLSDILEAFSDANFEVYNEADNTKIFKIDVSDVATGTTETAGAQQIINAIQGIFYDALGDIRLAFDFSVITGFQTILWQDKNITVAGLEDVYHDYEVVTGVKTLESSYNYELNSSSAGFTATLNLTAAGHSTIIYVANSANNIIIDGGTKNIDGAAVWTITANEVGGIYQITYNSTDDECKVNKLNAGVPLSGTTANEPTTGLKIGLPYFNTALNRPSFYNGSIFVTGRTVTLAAPTISASVLILDFLNNSEYKTTSEVSATADFGITLSNNTTDAEAHIDLHVTNTIYVTLPSGSIMQTDDTRFATATKILTIEGGTGTSFELSLRTNTFTHKWVLSQPFG